MSARLILDNLMSYSLQIGMLVGLAAFVPALLRLRLPGAKLAYWHILLAACLVLPLVSPWRQSTVAGEVQVTTTVLAVAQPRPAPRFSIPPAEAALLLLAAGVLARLAWLAAGLWRLRRYRRHSSPLEMEQPALGRPGGLPRIALCISGEISSPVTFGWRRPVILLPLRFPELVPGMQETILCHEMLHVARRDWLFTVGEELVRAAFWFHPAIWWLLGEIQLAREQAVDRAVVEMTKTRDEYVDALLEIAGARPQLDLAPAPLFLRKRHLKQRVVSIMKEVRMSRRRLIPTFAAGLALLAASCWLVTGTFPLAAAPQAVNDAAGVTIDMGGAAVLHRTSVPYPEAARAKGIQGSVVVEVKLDSTGAVSDARVIAGPDELRKAALGSVLDWHFAREAANATRQVSIAFQLPAAQSTAAARPAASSEAVGANPAPAPTFTGIRPNPAQAPPAPARPIVLRSIAVAGLSDQARSELLSRLPVHEGDTVIEEMLPKIAHAVLEFDEHLSSSVGRNAAGELVLSIAAPGSTPPPSRLRVGGSVQQTKLVSQPRPIYPAEAKEARIQGVVHLEAVIAKDGTIQKLDVISGHPLLASAAMEAVRQWVYQTTLLNGNPVEVVTQIDVNFTLSQ